MVLTARNQPDDVRQAITLGARDFLAKPFKDEQLLQRVGRLLRRAPARPAKAADGRKPPSGPCCRSTTGPSRSCSEEEEADRRFRSAFTFYSLLRLNPAGGTLKLLIR
jgi:DNA-binding response OmpR family regulator